MIIANPKKLVPKDVEFPEFGNLSYKEEGIQVLDRINERAKELGIRELGNTGKKKEANCSNNQNTRLADQVLLQDFPHLRARGVTIEQALRPEVWEAMLDSNTYGEFANTVIFPNEGQNEEVKRKIMDLAGLGNKIDVPYVISNLGYGLNKSELIGLVDEKATPIEAPGLRKDQRVKYDGQRVVPANDGEFGVMIYVPDNQAGARRLCRNWYDGLNAWGDSLGDAGGDGRVPIIQDPRGLAEILDKYLEPIRKAKSEILEETEKKS